METSVLILAAGYGTRLSKDVAAAAPKYDHLAHLPKALLPIKNKPLLSYWIESLEKLSVVKVSKVTVISNARFLPQFVEWLATHHVDSPLNIEILNDHTTTNENRLGCCKSIKFGMDKSKVDCKQPCLVIASDILFPRPYSLDSFFETWTPEISQVYVYPCKEEIVHKHGILEVDDTATVTSFLEKPQPHQTKSRLACPCFYIFNDSAMRGLDEFLNLENVPDSSGHFLRYLVEQKKDCTIKVSHIAKRYDIGNLESYLACNEEF